MSKKRSPETIVTKNLIDDLHKLGYTVKKIYNGGTPARVFNNKITYKKKNEEYKGIPDLIAYNVRQKKFFFIEAKRPDGKVKPEQAEFIKDFNSCTQFKAIVARDTASLLLGLGIPLD